MNAHLSAELPAAEDGGECAVETTPGVVAREKFRYMRDTIPDRVRAINARIRDVETRFRVADEDEEQQGGVVRVYGDLERDEEGQADHRVHRC